MKDIGNLNVKINWAFVLRINVSDIKKIKNFIESFDDTTVVFSTISGNRLYIKEQEATQDVKN